MFWRYLLGLMTLGVLSVRAQHAHLNAGAFQPTPGAQLTFVNGANFVTNSGYVLQFNEAGANTPYEGLFHASITFVSLPATLDAGGPAFGHASPGSFLELRTVGLHGPEGSEFGIWSEDEDTGDATKILSIASGVTNGLQQIVLSQFEAQPDPFGHIHGRRMTLSKPGFYTVGFQVVDTSGGGPGGGPIHPPSDTLWMYMQAGAFLTIAHMGHEVRLSFATDRTRAYQLEVAAELRGANTVWQPFGDTFTGVSGLQTVTDLRADDRQRYYRLRITDP